MIKMIVMDMDGTLLKSDHTISKETKEALIKVQNNGVKLVLASGRSYKTLKKYGDELMMNQYNGDFICSNGAVIAKASLDEIEYLKQLEVSDIKKIYNEVKDDNVEVMAVLDNAIYVNIPKILLPLKKQYIKDHNLRENIIPTAGAFNLVYDQEINYENIHLVNDENGFVKKANKMVVAQESLIIDQVYLKLKAIPNMNYEFTKTTPRWLEIAPSNINKGNTLLKLMQQYDINNDEVLVFGDGENDIEMLKVVKYSIAMGNAMPLVKENAYEITKSNNEDGIALIIKKYLESEL